MRTVLGSFIALLRSFPEMDGSFILSTPNASGKTV